MNNMSLLRPLKVTLIAHMHKHLTRMCLVHVVITNKSFIVNKIYFEVYIISLLFL